MPGLDQREAAGRYIEIAISVSPGPASPVRHDHIMDFLGDAPRRCPAYGVDAVLGPVLDDMQAMNVGAATVVSVSTVSAPSGSAHPLT